MTITQAIEKVIATAKAEVGYLEKKSNSNLDDKTANAGSNNYTKYWRDIANWGLGNYQAQYWCAAFIFWCFVKTFGQDKAKKLLLHTPYISCAIAGKLFKQVGRLYAEPQVGDIVLFMKSSGVFGHTGIVYKVSNGYFYTIEGNTSSAAGVVANGGAVAYKSYSIAGAKNSGHKFARPDYLLVSTSVTSSATINASTIVSTPTQNTLNKVKKWDGVVTADILNVRTYAGTNNGLCSFSPLKKGVKVSVCDSVKANDGSTWYYISYNGKYGFVHSSYISKQTTMNTSTSIKKIPNLASSNPNLKKGSKGTQVGYLQEDLNYIGFKGKDGKNLTVDKEFGTNTEYALKAFQKKYGLNVDGIYGSKSQTKIKTLLK